MTGFRVGWLHVAAERTSSCKHIIEAFASCGVPFSQTAAAAALKHEDEYAEIMRTSYEKNRDIALETLCEVSIPSKPMGAFYLLAKIHTDLSSTEFCLKMLNDVHVATAPGATFFENETSDARYIRLSLAPDENTVRNGTQIISEYLKRENAI